MNHNRSTSQSMTGGHLHRAYGAFNGGAEGHRAWRRVRFRSSENSLVGPRLFQPRAEGDTAPFGCQRTFHLVESAINPAVADVVHMHGAHSGVLNHAVRAWIQFRDWLSVLARTGGRAAHSQTAHLRGSSSAVRTPTHRNIRHVIFHQPS